MTVFFLWAFMCELHGAYNRILAGRNIQIVVSSPRVKYGSLRKKIFALKYPQGRTLVHKYTINVCSRFSYNLQLRVWMCARQLQECGTFTRFAALILEPPLDLLHQPSFSPPIIFRCYEFFVEFEKARTHTAAQIQPCKKKVVSQQSCEGIVFQGGSDRRVGAVIVSSSFPYFPLRLFSAFQLPWLRSTPFSLFCALFNRIFTILLFLAPSFSFFFFLLVGWDGIRQRERRKIGEVSLQYLLFPSYLLTWQHMVDYDDICKIEFWKIWVYMFSSFVHLFEGLRPHKEENIFSEQIG